MTTKSLTDCYGRRLTVENGRPGIHVHASETVGPFTSEQLRTALDEVAPAGSYTRTDEEDWQARAEKAEQSLTEIAQGGALTPDDITDEMVLRFLNAYDRLSDGFPEHRSLAYWTAGRVDLAKKSLAAARGAVPALLDENAALRARIKAVRELHVKEPGVGTAYCIDCEQTLPCETIRALDGDA